MALHELSTLLESGVPLGDAVQAQAEGTRHRALAASFESIAKALMRGQSFQEALRAGRLHLPSYVYHLVDAGELNGQLAEALRQSVEQMQYDHRVASEMRGALFYPSILIVAGCTAVLIVFVFVVPQFSGLLERSAELPLLAEAVLRARSLVRCPWMVPGGCGRRRRHRRCRARTSTADPPDRAGCLVAPARPG